VGRFAPRRRGEPEVTVTQADPQFELLLQHLKEARGFDFTGYKRSSLIRRVNRRMSQVAVTSYADYLDHLQVHPDEFTALFNTILVNVTGFFRDPDAWDFLGTEVIPPLLAAKETNAPIRIWSVGCASGEEAYSLAILLAEELGQAAFTNRVKVYATDVDEEQLGEARQASYTEDDLKGVSPERRDRYFEPAGNRYAFRKDLRRSVIFGRNDLVQDALISRIDLLACRNTLMYFNAETQARILSRFHFALGDGGVLFLGKAEMLLSHSSLFVPTDLKRRIFRKASRRAPANNSFFADPPDPPDPPARDELVGLDRLRTEAFLASPVVQIVVTSDGLVALSNRQAELLLGVSSREVGRPFRDLDISYRPVELRRYIDQAQVERRVARVTDVEFQRGPDTTWLEIQVNPLVDSDSSLLGVTLVFHDVTAAHRLRDELEHTNRQLETAYEELQSANEELETTNEELQSTVEELETTNEELQSINDELQNINDELRERTGQLVATEAFLEAVLTSLQAGVTVINRDLDIQVWNRQAEELWGLRREEVVGQRFLSLDIGLPTDELWPLIRKALAGDGTQQTEVAAVNRRGRSILVRVVCLPLMASGGQPTGAILMMEQSEENGRAAETGV
jgi:two-component system, chemotaxis family, CheB/CheR fusion protein